MSIVVAGTAFVDIKGFPKNTYIPRGRNAGRVEYIHGGVGRNVAEDIANLGLRSIYIGLVDESPMGRDVLAKLNRHKVCTDYVITTPDGLGTWLAVFDSNGDVAGSISHRPHTYPLLEVLEEKGDEIFAKADSVVLEADIDWDVVKKVFALARKYDKKVLSVVGNMSIFASRRESLREFDCLICNQQEAELLFQDDYSALSPEEMSAVLAEKVRRIGMSFMVVTMGSRGGCTPTGMDCRASAPQEVFR